jgi:hypothetical protein
VAWVDKLREAKARLAARDAEPWLARLERVRGKIDFDGLERVSTQTLLDLLEVPQRNRRAGTYRRLARVMAQLGWTAVRVRDMTRGGYKEQVRGYCRDGRNRHSSAACGGQNTRFLTPRLDADLATADTSLRAGFFVGNAQN